MKQGYTISLFLDVRTEKKNGLFPVKMKVYEVNNQKQKFYSTIFEFSKSEFNSIWNTQKPRTEYKATRNKMLALELKASKIAEKLHPFSFEQFEKLLFNNSTNDSLNLEFLYKEKIKELLKRNQIGNASTYELSQKSFIKFVEETTKGKYNKLTLRNITPTWLKDYEFYMTENNKSLTTVSMYLRTLRAIFNNEISNKEIELDYYPFGKKKYQVPATKNVKKAYSSQELKKLFESIPLTKEQEKAKDFWFFSFACNGMNIKDILLLRFKDIKEDKIEFFRAKTINTSKSNLKPITVFLNDYSIKVIKKYANKNNSSNNYVFDILNDNLTPKEEQVKIKNFTRFINQNIKKLCKSINLPENISTYWARHSFATNAIRNGATIAFMQESLGHSSPNTTVGYFAGFDNETKKEFANTIMNFD